MLWKKRSVRLQKGSKNAVYGSSMPFCRPIAR